MQLGGQHMYRTGELGVRLELQLLVYGFALSEASLPINGPETVTEVAEQMMEQYIADEYPHLVEFSVEHVMKPGYDYGEEFEFGLSVVLDGLAQAIQPQNRT